jgi:hypothetical protein
VDGTIREASLDDTDRYRLIVDSDAFGDAVGPDGHVTVVMPQICAVCGAPPTTTCTPEDDSYSSLSDDNPDDDAELAADRRKGRQTQHDLAALAVPLCAAHAREKPVSYDGPLVVMLAFTSYRYYRAFVVANQLPRHAKRATATARPPRVTPGQLEPLLCQSCGAPLPVGAGDTTTCAACGHEAPLPEPYRQLRDAKRLSDQDAAQLAALAADVARPPPAWKRTAMIVGYAVGGVTLAVMALGAIIGGIAGMMAGSRAGETVSKVLGIAGAVVVGIVSVPVAGEWLAGLALLHHTSAATAILSSPAPAYHYDLVAAAILYGLGVVPLALAFRTQGNLAAITELQRKLAARPSTVPGGGPCCRHCGAALEVPRGALVSRCLYCGADNLLTVAADQAEADDHEAKQLDAQVQDAMAQHARDRADERATMWGLLGLGLVLAPYLCAAGYVFHAVFVG